MMGVCCKNTIIINVLSTKLNDNPQVDTVDMFQSKDFVICAFHVPLLSASLHILCWG